MVGLASPIVGFQLIALIEEDVPWDNAWQIVTKTFAFTNHRHLQIIYDLNWVFLQNVAKKFPNDVEKMARMSLVEEGHGQQIRMANLAV
jgi:starch phosphorylase